jgi:hypothetical protein
VAVAAFWLELVEVPLDMMDNVVVREGVVASVDVEEITGEFGVVEEAEATGTVKDAGLGIATLLVAEVPNVGAVDVELTNGGAFSMYEPFGCVAYSPTSRSPLGVSYKYPPVV